MKKIITYGTFDLLHYGHINLLERAKKLGDYLIVAISTDQFNEIKGKKSYFKFLERKRMIEALRFVDEVIEEREWSQKEKDIKEKKIDIFVMGDDWIGEFDYLKEYCEVKYLKRTKNISTSEIKKDLSMI